MSKRNWRIGVGSLLALVLLGGVITVNETGQTTARTHITAYFANSTGVFPGDEVRILGVRVGKIDTIEAEPQQVKITFWVDAKYPIPLQAKAAILSPSLISARAIQLVPAYVGGPALQSGAVIPLQRTAVPVEWDGLRKQLQKLVDALQPTEQGGVSTVGAFINTAADNLRGQGANIRETIVELSQAFSALGDHSDDLFSTIRSLSVVVAALHDSADLMRRLNQNLAAVTALLANQPEEVGRAVTDISDAASAVQAFAEEVREPVGGTTDKLASISAALHESLDDVKQTLHIAPTLIANFVDLYPPAVGGFAGAFSLNNFANPISFLCGAIQAASRLNYEQSAKLCVQYLAPIFKNRQYNFPPLGLNPFVGAMARPNEVTYSEDWLRPDYVPPSTSPESDVALATPALEGALGAPALPAEAPPAPTNLRDLMVPGS